jgi:hypothetical protein
MTIHEHPVWKSVVIHAADEGLDLFVKEFGDGLRFAPNEIEMLRTAMRMAASISLRCVSCMAPNREQFLDAVKLDTEVAIKTGRLGCDGALDVEGDDTRAKVE